MRYLTLNEILRLHDAVVAEAGGASDILNLGALQSALAQPQMTFDGEDLYPSVADKASTLAFTIAMNHPFLDGNKRTAHAAMEVFLVMNGFEIRASVNEQERIMLALAAGELGREEFSGWVRSRVVELSLTQ